MHTSREQDLMKKMCTCAISFVAFDSNYISEIDETMAFQLKKKKGTRTFLQIKFHFSKLVNFHIVSFQKIKMNYTENGLKKN